MPAKKMLARPETIHVGPFVYVIEYMSEDVWANANESSDDMGACRSVQGSIRIRLAPDISEQVIRECLLHEVMHAVWHSTQLCHHIDKDNIEEHSVAVMSPMILQVLIDNPELVGYLVGE